MMSGNGGEGTRGGRMRQATERPTWAPATIDIDRPSAARMYDYFLGGSQNFAVDREAARQVIAAIPDAPLMAQENRAFLRRVVRYLTGVGIRQFLDVGSGIPTAGNVHEIAQRAVPDARVVYVDVDPAAVAHSREILAGNDRATAIQADIREPAGILTDREVLRLLDFDQPIGLMIVSVLHFVPDAADPRGLVAQFRSALAPGSYVALSQLAGDSLGSEERALSEAVYRRTAHPLYPRNRADVVRIFDGLEMVEPGAVWVGEWRPDSPDCTTPGSAPTQDEPGEPDDHRTRSVFLGGVGRVPERPPPKGAGR
jgi:SAM-dependent methyltransferase